MKVVFKPVAPSASTQHLFIYCRFYITDCAIQFLTFSMQRDMRLRGVDVNVCDPFVSKLTHVY